MGKHWLHWIGGGGGGDGSGRSSTRRGRISGEMETSTGCMCSVFQLFDLHHFQLPLNHQNSTHFHPNNPFLHEEATTSKGVEAPRNSLELEEATSVNAASSMSSAIKGEENLNFPVGINQIKASHGRVVSSPRVSNCTPKSRLDDLSSESSSNSPGIKTPSLVARLMGLDLLPESCSSSPSVSSSKPQIKPRGSGRRSSFDDDIVSRSLPETPRISSARRSDVEYHRLSLQIHKENTVTEEYAASEKMVSRRGRFRLQQRDENTSPGHCAKQIVKHVKENVSRRVGLDITNTVYRNRDQTRKDEYLIVVKKNSKNILSRFEGEISPDGKDSNKPSSSPKLRFLDPNKSKPITNSATKSPLSSDNHHSQGIINPWKPKPQLIIPFQEHRQTKKDSSKVKSAGKCSLPHLKKLTPQAIRNKKDESFIRSTATNKVNLTENKSKRTPLSSDILNISSPIPLQPKKGPSPPPTKLPQKQSQVSDAPSSKRSTQLSSNSSHSYNQLQLYPDKILRVPENIPQDSTNGCATRLPGGALTEYRDYVQTILKCAGIVNKNLNPLAKWHVPSHPIDPSIFHHLELSHPTTTNTGGATVLSHRHNRKLIFQLVDELLADILRPSFNLHPWISDDQLSLADELCKKIYGFPAANCLVLEDIDSLIDGDLRKWQLNGFFEEEERLVCEIEGEIVEGLVRETMAVMGGRKAEEQTLTDRFHVDGFTR